MSRPRFYLRREWLLGAALAIAGVLLARGAGAVAGAETKTRAWIVLAGELIALGGLLTIALGINRRSRQPPPVSE